MAQLWREYRGMTWKLMKALDLSEKPNLSPSEVDMVIEGSRLCTRQGFKLLTDGRDQADVLETVNALASTSTTLLERVRSALECLHEDGPPTGSAAEIAEQLNEISRESAYLTHWVHHMSDQDMQPRYDA